MPTYCDIVKEPRPQTDRTLELELQRARQMIAQSRREARLALSHAMAIAEGTSKE
jgi:hypothetical protein